MAKKAVSKLVKENKEEGLVELLTPKPVEIVDTGEWRMPKPERGECVIIYPRGTMSSRNAAIAFVVSISERSVDCVFMNNAYGDCIHRDDPRLAPGAPILDDLGAIWEFRKDSTSSKIEELEKRIEKLEG